PKMPMATRGRFFVTWDSNYQDGSGFGVFAQRFNADGQPTGPEFQVNTYTLNDQQSPDISMDRDGNFVIVWASPGHDGSDLGVIGRRFHADGSPIGGEFQVNTFTEGNQPANELRIRVSMDDSGSFIVAWKSQPPDTFGVYVQRYNS